MRPVPRLLLLAAVVIWGWTFVATKVLLEEIGPVEILALRLALGTPCVGLLLWARRVPLGFTCGDLPALLGGGAVFTLHFLLQISGLLTTTATNTGWIIAVSPLALALLSLAVLGERLGRFGALGIAVATCGIVLLISRGRFADLGWLSSTGDWLVLASAFTWALYTVATRNLARRRHPLAVTFAVLVLASGVTAGLFLATGDFAAVRSLSLRGLLGLLYLAIPGMALAQWFWQEGVAHLGASHAGLYLYLEPIATLALAVPFLGEPLGPFVLLGGALVLAGVWIGQRPPRRSSPGGTARDASDRPPGTAGD